ncbi:MAG: hypothetical protein KDC05_10140, partial [Bacteroidales bacterium]|nr:hypothetical protein [Bacteroidales bacterium]
MKKFTRLWQLMMILLLSSSVAFGQYKSAIPTNTADAKAKQSEKVNNQAEKTRVSKQMQVMQDEEMQSPASEINTAAPSQVTAPADLTKQEEIKKAQEATQSAAIQAQGASISAYLDKPMSNAVYDPKLYPVPDQGGDDIATAVVLSGALPITSSGTTSGYTDDYDEICPYGPSTAPDVVYSYTPAGNQDVDIDLCGSLYDTKLFVYENAYTPGAPFACNDDFYTVAGDPCGQWVSKIEGVTLTGGNTYYIVVDGYDAASFGDYSLEIRDYVPPDPCVWGIDIQCPTGATAETELC